MKLFIRLVIAFVVLELLLLGCSAVSKWDHPVLFSPLFPAIWIAMVIGGVHSAGFFSFATGLAITALLYSGVLFGVIAMYSKVRNRKQME